MKRLTIVLLTSLFVVLSFASSYANGVKTDWGRFSKSVNQALKSDHEGLKLAALGLVIRYADHIQVNDARKDIRNIFLRHENPKVRQLALVALNAIHNDSDLDFLLNQREHEQNAAIKNHITWILLESGSLKMLSKNQWMAATIVQ